MPPVCFAVQLAKRIDACAQKCDSIRRGIMAAFATSTYHVVADTCCKLQSGEEDQVPHVDDAAPNELFGNVHLHDGQDPAKFISWKAATLDRCNSSLTLEC